LGEASGESPPDKGRFFCAFPVCLDTSTAVGPGLKVLVYPGREEVHGWILTTYFGNARRGLL
jgi:hypothetical protein